MAPILIFRHIECEGPGFLGDFLQAREILYKVICIDKGHSVPDNPDGASGLVFMGGPMSVHDPHVWLEKELQLIKSAMEKGIPVLGHCLGGQLVAKAMAAKVTRNPVPEIGWHEVERLPGDHADEWFGDFSRFPAAVFHWHGETFATPAGATRILKSRFCENQGFVSENTLALQCHVEITRDQIDEWSTLYSDQIARTSQSVQSRNEMTSGAGDRISNMHELATRLYNRWLRGVLHHAGQ